MAMRFQFSLRTFLALVAVAGVFLLPLAAYLYRVRTQVRRQEAAVSKLEADGARLSEGKPQANADDRDVAFARKWVDSNASVPRKHASLSPKDLLTEQQALDRLRALTDVTGVETLQLTVERITPEIAAELLKFPKLYSLHLNAQEIDPKAESLFAKMENMATLYAIFPAGDSFVDSLTKMPKLDAVTIDATRLTPLGQQTLAKCDKLTGLTVTGRLRGAQLFSTLGKRGGLGSLNLWKCDLDAEAVESIGRLHDLVAFRLHADERIEGDVAAALAKLPKLTSLLLRPDRAPLTSEQIGRLGAIKGLSDVDLAQSILVEDDMAKLASLTAL